MYEIILEYPAERFIKSLERDKQIRVRDFIRKLAENPNKGKRLLGRLECLRILGFDNFRVIYKVEEMKLIVLVLRIGYRRDIADALNNRKHLLSSKRIKTYKN